MEKEMNNNNNENNENFDMLDIITVIGFLAQMANMSGDEIQAQRNNAIIKAIADEIDKLHKENDDIITAIKQMDKHEELIIKYLKDIILILRGRL